MIKIHLSRILGEKRLTQKKLAELANVRPNTINIMYHEQLNRLDLDVLNRICSVLNCQPGDLMEFIPDEQ